MREAIYFKAWELEAGILMRRIGADLKSIRERNCNGTSLEERVSLIWQVVLLIRVWRTAKKMEVKAFLPTCEGAELHHWLCQH